ncbi:site-2 protease family protein [Roseateles chitinivorans]|uniref:site-2 protease family protein n=1 Tax=Roseateles chitinivorans TaxID=2917965 RepID=UPI003D679DD3
MAKLLFLLFSGVKLSKLLLSGGTMLLSVLLYATLYGWRYAVGFVAMIVIHELGHFFAARHRGLPAGLPMLIPFIGAWTSLEKMPHDAETEAFVGLGGPLLGAVAATGCYLMARSWNIDWLLAISYAGFFLNLFNLIPMLPFDGGRITAVLSPRIWFAGVPIMVGLFLYRPSPMLLLIALLAAPQLMKAWKYRADSEEAQTYYAVPARVKWEYAAYYLGLAAFLAVMAHDVHEMLGAARHLGGDA